MTQQQLKASEKVKATEIIALQRKLATERETRRLITEKWQEASTLMSSSAVSKKIGEISSVATTAELAVGTQELEKIIAGANTLAGQVDELTATLQGHATVFSTLTTQELRTWKLKDDEVARTIETKRQELEAQGVRLDMAFIHKLATDEACLQEIG